jgi:carbamoyltransferase
MLIAGLQRGHDAGAVLIRDGQLEVIVEAERVTGSKHADGNEAAAAALLAGLKEIGAEPRDVDGIVITDSYWEQIENKYPDARKCHHDTDGLFKIGTVGDMQHPVGAIGVEGLRPDVPIHALCHHLAHAAGTFFLSGFDKANALVADGYGVCSGTSAYVAEGNKLKRMESWVDKFLLGWRYQIFAEFIQEIDKKKTLAIDFAGKIMGLQAYGKATDPAYFREWFFKPYEEYAIADKAMVDPTGDFWFFKDRPNGGYGRNTTHARDPVFLNDLASMQAAFTEIMCEAAQQLQKETGNKKLVVSGGCALNVVANTELARLCGPENLYISPVSGDSGLALGAAVAGAVHLDKAHDPYAITPAEVRRSAYLGISFDYDIADKKMPRGCLRLPRAAEDPRTAEELYTNISQGAIIGVVQGRCEIGPRALGHRSILANPAYTDMKDTLNSKIKYREWWRPFAPVCRKDDARKFFDVVRECPYMLYSATVKPEWRERLPSITHEDGTARLQVIESREDNPLLWDILTLFAEKTGCGVLLNTSFNLGGKPLVNRWSEVMEMLEKTKMDAVWVNGELVVKPHQYVLKGF